MKSIRDKFEAGSEPGLRFGRGLLENLEETD